jgi:hypothetical protein
MASCTISVELALTVVAHAVGSLEHGDRHQHVVVEAAPHRRLLFFEYSDDHVLPAVDLDGLVQRIREREKRLGKLVADHDDLSGQSDVLVGQIPAELDVVRIVWRILGRPAADRHDRFGGSVLVFRGGPETPQLGAHEIDPRNSLAHGVGVIHGDRLAALDLAPIDVGVTEPAGRPLLDLKRRRAQHAELVLHRGLNHRDARHHGDDRGHAGDDPDQGQRRTQFVRPDRSQRHA